MRSVKSAYACGSRGGALVFGATAHDGGVYMKQGSTFTRRESCGISHAYHASPSGVCQSAQETPVRSSVTPSVCRSSSTLSTRSCSPGRNHSSMPMAADGWRLTLEDLRRSFERLKWPL